MRRFPQRVVSGGQTGVDRGALDAALARRVPHGGWCPKGRLAEDGPIPDRYALVETPTADYAERTLQNVLDSDGTLVLFGKELTGGTGLTAALARRHGKPLWMASLDEPADLAGVRDWLSTHQIDVLNVAGPRESQFSGARLRAFQFVYDLLDGVRSAEGGAPPTEP